MHYFTYILSLFWLRVEKTFTTSLDFMIFSCERFRIRNIRQAHLQGLNRGYMHSQ